MNEIKAGDVVYLKGNMQTKLTVEYIFNHGINSSLAVMSAKCAWFINGEKKDAIFALDSLVNAG